MENRNAIYELNNVKVKYCNFAGNEGRFNEAGNRNFTVVLSEEDYIRMNEIGMNVKVHPPLHEGDDPTYTMKVNVSYRYYTPKVIIGDGENFHELDKDELNIIDEAEMDGTIIHVDLTFRTSRSAKRTDNYGLSAYLKSIELIIDEDPIVKRYNARRAKAEDKYTPF